MALRGLNKTGSLKSRCDNEHDQETPSRKRPAATRKSGNECTVCNAYTYIFLSDFVSIENKEAMNKIPKLKVASSSLVARSILLSGS